MNEPDINGADAPKFDTFPKIIDFFKEKLLGEYDLLFMVTYMAAISNSHISRQQIFAYTSERNEYVTSKYITRVHLLAQNWNFEYSKACKVVAENTSNEHVKDFLGRFSNALTTGEPERNFLEGELDTLITKYTNRYERDIDSLKKWIDAYSALLVSSILIVMIEVISLMLYNIGSIQSVVGATTYFVALVGGIAVYLLYSAAPKEVKTHRMYDGSKEQMVILKLSKILVPLMILSAIGLPLIGIPISIILIVLAILMIPIGIIGWIDDMNIEKRDRDLATFIKTLGITTGSSGVTLNVGLSQMQQESLGVLEGQVKRLHARLSLGLNERMCWEKFAGETGSELINRLTSIFVDAISLGGNPDDIGKIVSRASLGITLLQMKRKALSATFTGLVVPLHTTMIGVLLFVVGLLTTFNEMVQEMMTSDLISEGASGANMGGGLSSLNVLGTGSLEVALSFATSIIVILTIADTMAVKVAAGGGNYKYFQYGMVMFLISGVSIILVPIIVRKAFTLPGM